MLKRQFERRHFLQLSAALGASVCASRSGWAASNPAARISLGYSLYGMRAFSLESAIDHAAEIGYDAIELASIPGWPADPKLLSADARGQLAKQLARLGLGLPALMENWGLGVDDRAQAGQLERLASVAQLGHELEPDHPPLIETVVGGKPGEWPTLKDKYVDRLGQWAEAAARAKTIVAIKPHRFGALNTPADAVWLVDQVRSPWIRLAYDYSHFQFRDLPLAETLDVMLPHTVFIHVKDTVLDKGQARFVLPGEGKFDFAALFGELKARGWQGCVCVEVSAIVQKRPDYDPLAAARSSYEHLAQACSAAGAERTKRSA
jgi:inosose dehydratase